MNIKHNTGPAIFTRGFKWSNFTRFTLRPLCYIERSL